MATLEHIRKRIRSVKNTQKITKAMKMVAAARLRRAQQAMLSARPFSKELNDLFAAIVPSLSPEDIAAHPLLAPRHAIARTAVILFTSDRGLCGAFNTNVIKKAISVIAEEKALGRAVELTVYGRKGRDGMTARHHLPHVIDTDIGKWNLEDLKSRLLPLLARYESGELDGISLVYNRFVSAISQEPTTRQLLPVDAFAQPAAASLATTDTDYAYEPDRLGFARVLIEKLVFSNFQLAYLESLASELAARMSAMDSATKNASDMIRQLTLTYNRARQAAITLELMDIVNGAEAIS